MLQLEAESVSMPPVQGNSPHLTGGEPEVLNHILNPGVNLCLWQRRAQPAISNEIISLQASSLPDVRRQTSQASFENDVVTLLQQQGLEPSAFRNWCMDMQHLAGLFFSVSEGREATIRLVTTEEDDCRRYHVDRSHLRLLCTYRGPGTEWLTDAQVDREAQVTGAPNERILRYGEPLKFDPFWAGILKGENYPGNAGRGLVHRSPPIAASGTTRVLFCLDC